MEVSVKVGSVDLEGGADDDHRRHLRIHVENRWGLSDSGGYSERIDIDLHHRS
jgi:hypothetical protein